MSKANSNFTFKRKLSNTDEECLMSEEVDRFKKPTASRKSNTILLKKAQELNYINADVADIIYNSLNEYQKCSARMELNNVNIYEEDCEKLLKSIPNLSNLNEIKSSIKSLKKFIKNVNVNVFNSENAEFFNRPATQQQTELSTRPYPHSQPPTSATQSKISQSKTKFVCQKPSSQLQKSCETTPTSDDTFIKKTCNYYQRQRHSECSYSNNNNTTDNLKPLEKLWKPSTTTQSTATIPLHSVKPQPLFQLPQRNQNRSIEKPAIAALTNDDFRTARDEFEFQMSKKSGGDGASGQKPQFFAYGSTTKSLGYRRNVKGKFINPVKPIQSSTKFTDKKQQQPQQQYEINMESSQSMYDSDESNELIIDERLKNIDPKMIELIRNEIMDRGTLVEWDDIAGLEYVKTTIKEAVIWPLLRPDCFQGLRTPPRGILLFGPPGTGKTLIGKCIAAQSKATFFSISASSLTSKWIGDGEKMVRALFAVAAVHQPAVIFIDEIDSLLCQRSETEHESSRRLKTEFLIQLDGATTLSDERILIVGATNRPQELDEAARRRLVKRLYIPLPEFVSRIAIVKNLLKTERTSITDVDIDEIGRLTDGFSGADMKTLCQEASMGPMRSILFDQIDSISIHDIRPIDFEDFQNALKRVRSSVSVDDLAQYIVWNRTYGADC